MQGVPAYKILNNKNNILADGPEKPDIVEIAGIAYLYYRESGILANLQAISQKFESWEEVKSALGGV